MQRNFGSSSVRKLKAFFYIWIVLVLAGCSTKKNNLFTRQYHQLTTRYNVYFNGNEALKSGVKKMEQNHKEDYTNLLPVFISNSEQTRNLCSSDMDYAIEKAVKAIDKHSITSKPRRRKNKDSKNYETFRKKKEFNNQIAKCYLLLAKAYFYKKKYAMANNTLRYLQRQYPDQEKLQWEIPLWMFRSLTEMGRYEEAVKYRTLVEESKLKREQKEMFAAAKTDFYVRQGDYAAAIPEGEQLIGVCRSMKRKPRYHFMLSQLYLKENQDAQAMYALKKAVRFNFNYEMVFNAKINMALAYQSGDEGVQKKLRKMLKDRKNADFQDRIYYALANIEEKKGELEKAVELYWKSVQTSVDNDNQKSLSFRKLGDYYFGQKDFIPAQSCYDSCVYFMDSRAEGYEQLKSTLTDLTELVTHLNTIQLQDSLQKLAALPAEKRLEIIDARIQEIREEENRIKEEERLAQQERNFYNRNDMLSRGDAFSQGNRSSGDWYFYNPVTVALGKNDFKRKWGRRKLEDNWRRTNKTMVELSPEGEVLADQEEGEKEQLDKKSREYYLKDVPLTPEKMAESRKMVENAYYKAGELYLYTFEDPEKAFACFEAFIKQYPESSNLPLVYYLAYEAAEKSGKNSEAENYKRELIAKFPDSDFAKGLQDPEYFRKVDHELKVVEKLYEEAFARYENVYYKDALQITEDIMKRYPENKMRVNVMFLRAMCMVNLYPVQEARKALNAVLELNPGKNMREVVTSILASLDVGDEPVLYADSEMAEARLLKANRNWVFEEETEKEKEETRPDELPFKADLKAEQEVILLLPEGIKKSAVMQMQMRLGFINAAQTVEGHSYKAEKEDLWYKTTAFRIAPFKDYEEAAVYLNRIATDKVLLKHLSGKNYRIFAIDHPNFSVLKRLKNTEAYVEFFVTHYFSDRYEGELLAGIHGTSAHMFKYKAEEKHDFVLNLPFRKVNVKKIAELLHSIEPAFSLVKEDYDEEHEMIVVKNVGNKEQALEYINTVMKNKDLFERLSGVENQYFVITQSNLDILLENQYLEEYLKFFHDNYLRNANEIGVEEGDFVYNKSVPHRFVLFYSNEIDPFKLKTVFDAYNFAGLTLNNYKYDEDHDCLVVSGFGNKEEAMRYFHSAINNRKLFKPLRNTDYRNFVISEGNFESLRSKKAVDQYLVFFKKYYLD